MKALTKLILCGLIITSSTVSADDTDSTNDSDNENLNEIYQLFMQEKVDVEKIRKRYASNIIHVGAKQLPLIVGREQFINKNIEPIVKMIVEGQLKVEMVAYIVRRTVGPILANDVGYLYSKIQVPGQETLEQLQKFSWVFQKNDGVWKVITDFDSSVAPLETLSQIEPVIIIGTIRPPF